MKHKQYVFAIDAMGGDRAPVDVIAGLNHFLFTNADSVDIHFRVFGPEAKMRALFKKYPRVAKYSTIIHAPDKINGTDKLREIIRTSQNTSMYMAIKDVREGNSIAIISAGNTGILMALSKLSLKTIDGISRPAIVTMLPAGGGDKKVVLLDLGANAVCDEENLIDFAVMGSVYAKTMGGVNHPKLGLLNIGEEDQKGLDSLRNVNTAFKNNSEKLPFEYIGFVEGNDISHGVVEVVVTDGFTGNIVLKTVEGTAKLITRVMKDTFKKSLIAILMSFFLFHVFKRLKAKLDPRSYAGAVFIGLNGFVVKTHGNSDVLTFANAVKYALELSTNDFNGHIQRAVAAVKDVKQQVVEA